MTLTLAPHFKLRCSEEGCEESLSTNSLDDACQSIAQHRDQTGHMLLWGSERHEIPDITIGSYRVQCEVCGNKKFQSVENANLYHHRHLEQTDHDVAEPIFAEEDLSSVSIERLVQEVTQRGLFSDGVPSPTILTLAQGEHRSPQLAYLKFQAAVKNGDIYERTEGKYLSVKTSLSG